MCERAARTRRAFEEGHDSCSRGERNADLERRHLAVLELLCEDTQSQNLSLGHRFVRGVAIGEDTG